jgi:DNA helicase-2/ATP-dependent DNA helicase PcrA
VGKVGLRDRVRGEPSPAVAAPALSPVTYLAGQKVFHPKFGEGRVLEATERSGDQEVAVEFVRHGTKRLLASLAAMETLD